MTAGDLPHLDIKNRSLLESLRGEMEYRGIGSETAELCKDAHAAISQLQADNARLREAGAGLRTVMFDAVRIKDRAAAEWDTASKAGASGRGRGEVMEQIEKLIVRIGINPEDGRPFIDIERSTKPGVIQNIEVDEIEIIDERPEKNDDKG